MLMGYIFSFAQLPGVDPFLNSTMKSTGEVMGIGNNLEEATAKAFLSILRAPPKAKTVAIRVNRNEELEIIPLINKLLKLGFKVKIAVENKKILENPYASKEFLETIEFYKDNVICEHLFHDVFLFINTLKMDNSKYNKSNYRKFLLKNHIINCTNFHHARGIIRALQFYLLKDLEPMALT